MRNSLKQLQSDTSVLQFLLADKARFIVSLIRENYLEKCMDHINNAPYQLRKKDSKIINPKLTH